jgi:hypothetical protein
VRNFAIILALPFALAGCELDISPLLLPMEPTRESIAAPRRELTDAEKEAISAAVIVKLGGSSHRDFKWFPLVVRSHDHVVDFCGLVSGDDIVGEYDIHDYNAEFRKFYAQLNFERSGALSKVNVISIGRSISENIPTAVDFLRNSRSGASTSSAWPYSRPPAIRL